MRPMLDALVIAAAALAVFRSQSGHESQPRDGRARSDRLERL